MNYQTKFLIAAMLIIEQVIAGYAISTYLSNKRSETKNFSTNSIVVPESSKLSFVQNGNNRQPQVLDEYTDTPNGGTGDNVTSYREDTVPYRNDSNVISDAPALNFTRRNSDGLGNYTNNRVNIDGDSAMVRCMRGQLNTTSGNVQVCIDGEAERNRAGITENVNTYTTNNSVSLRNPKIYNSTAYSDCMDTKTGGISFSSPQYQEAIRQCEQENQRFGQYQTVDQCIAAEIQQTTGSPFRKLAKAKEVCEEQFGNNPPPANSPNTTTP